MAVFFTADTHFGHSNIIRYCGRPFADADEMDEAMIGLWNGSVGEGDDVYVLGDFAWRDAGRYLRRLRGRKHLVLGNHDGGIDRDAMRMFASVSERLEISAGGMRVVMSHEPMRSWAGCESGSVHLFGHVHGRMRTYNLSFDAGVDARGYAPWGLDGLASEVRRRRRMMALAGRVSRSGGKVTYRQDDVAYLEGMIESDALDKGRMTE